MTLTPGDEDAPALYDVGRQGLRIPHALYLACKDKQTGRCPQCSVSPIWPSRPRAITLGQPLEQAHPGIDIVVRYCAVNECAQQVDSNNG